MITKAVIPAAGLGTRLYPLTRAQPKEMLPLGRKPAIQLVVEECVEAGLNEILFINGRTKRAIEDHFDNMGNGNGCGPLFPEMNGRLRFFYVRQSEPRGLGDAVAQAEAFIRDESFVVALGDAVIKGNGGPSLLRRMIALHEDRSPGAIVAVRRVPRERISSYGVVHPVEAFDERSAFRIDDIVEKPPPDEAPSDFAITARYIFTPAIFDYLADVEPGVGGEIQLTDAIRAMVHDGHEVWAVPLQPGEVRYDVGNFLEYAKAFLEIALSDPEVGAELTKHLHTMLNTSTFEYQRQSN